MNTFLRKFKMTIQNLFTTYFEIYDQSMFDQCIILDLKNPDSKGYSARINPDPRYFLDFRILRITIPGNSGLSGFFTWD